MKGKKRGRGLPGSHSKKAHLMERDWKPLTSGPGTVKRQGGATVDADSSRSCRSRVGGHVDCMADFYFKSPTRTGKRTLLEAGDVESASETAKKQSVVQTRV
eukprot:GGOE01028620.1.p1 GENE.GGOE01028620.1~~GGOE01028620.1.p1  ORF type:complete len:102 (+),score=2.34 GGOE01028620.1:255-560(+)